MILQFIVVFFQEDNGDAAAARGSEEGHAEVFGFFPSVLSRRLLWVCFIWLFLLILLNYFGTDNFEIYKIVVVGLFWKQTSGSFSGCIFLKNEYHQQGVPYWIGNFDVIMARWLKQPTCIS